MKYTLFTDGGSRGNPGPGAIGIILKDENGTVCYQKAKYLGICTNNEAEYTALLQGLIAINEKGIDQIFVKMDSELVVKQLKGEYKVKNENLKKIYQKIKELEKKFKYINFLHIPREQNFEADALVNDALDNNGR